MSFIPENTPFVSLPTALKGRIDPYQLAVLWVLQSYYPNIWPSYNTIAKDAGMSRGKVMHVVEQLVSLGWLQKVERHDEHGQKPNAYRVTVWHECQIPAPMRGTPHVPPSIPHELGESTTCTGGGSPHVPEVKQVELKQKSKNKKNDYSEEFQVFWKKYQGIKKRASSQSKPLAWQHFQKIQADKRPALVVALTCAIADHWKTERDGGFASPFPDAYRWIRDGRYEAFLEESPVVSEASMKPWLADAPEGAPF